MIDWKNVKGSVLKIVEAVGKWLWPEVCPFCGKANRSGICASCRKEVDQLRIVHPRCMKCGKPVSQPEQEYCYDCMHAHHWYDRGVSVWVHRPPVSTSIYQFKYHNQRRYGALLAKEMVSVYEQTIRKWAPDLIMPIPVHRKRMKKRGYNQAQILAEEIGKTLGILVDTENLARWKDTDPQKMLGTQARKRNLMGAFAVRKSFLPVPCVLLVDDIYTTGNTIDAAARILKKCGVEKVYFLTISIGQGY